MNDFETSLQLSENPEAKEILDSYYRDYFPNVIGIIRNQPVKSHSQLMGVDVHILLDSLLTINIDEKIRKDYYGDVLLEYESSDYGNTKGWILKDLSINYIVYYIIPIQKAYFLDWFALKRAWKMNNEDWFKRYTPKFAENEGYTTSNLPIPFLELYKQITRAMIIPPIPSNELFKSKNND